MLRRRIRNIALAGRLRVSEARALDLIHAVGTGTVLTLLQQPTATRDATLSVSAREAVISAITGDGLARPSPGPAGAATALRASLDRVTLLSDGERLLLAELLDRISNADV